MNASCKGAQNIRLCNIRHAQLEPILWATSGYGGLFFSVYGMWLCACEHLFPMTNTAHFPICLYQRFGRKTAWNKPRKGCLSPSSQHLAGSNESISLRSLVACHFGRFQLNTHYQLAVGRNERFRELLLQAWVTAQNPPFESRRWSQTITDQGEDLYWHLGSSRRAPVAMTTATMAAVFVVSHLQYYTSRKNRPPVFIGAERSFSVIMAHFSAEISGNSCEWKMSRPPFISARCPVMFWVT